MAKTIAFIRVNNNNSEYTLEQVTGLKNYASEKNIEIDEHMSIEVNVPKEEQNITYLFEDCKQGCTILAYDLNVFGRTIEAIVATIRHLLDNEVRICVVVQNLDLVSKDDMLTKMILGMMDMTMALEKDLMSLRTKEALTAKKMDGIILGKPKGTIQKSKFDKQRDKIEELLSVGLSVRKIAKVLGYNNHIGLNNYVKKRNIREKVTESLIDLAS
ncbi:MAG: recombinase family protein [Campylobacterota bacterium]|nr:recombinase family protein [Campylobacterota bacterium]